MPALRPLVLVLKSFLKQRKLGSAASGGLSSYGIICAIISFLQVCRTAPLAPIYSNLFDAVESHKFTRRLVD